MTPPSFSAAGTYSATYTATTAGTGLKAALKLGGVNASSAAYAITAGAVTSATLTVDKASYVAGSPLVVTATLKDAQGNPVPAQAGALKEAVTAANAVLSGNWIETGAAGTYSATYTATTAGTGLKAALKLGGVNASSAAYAITAGAVTSATLTVDKA
ncbi:MULTISPECIES: hypothetical protein, partial [unclassified Pseudomonas]|uniref:hypothetical protein n=1 Tax=unclassified Pseudomonas TaxID=196821 RepID=UPI001C476DA1